MSGIPRLTTVLLIGCLLAVGHVAGDELEDGWSWQDVVSDGDSFVFGRFVGKFDSPEFSSRRLRVANVDTDKEYLLRIDDGLGYFAETVPPGMYSVESIEAVYYPRIRPLRPDKIRPILQKFVVKPKSGDAQVALILVPRDRPAYVGTIQAGEEQDGVIYRGHQLRVLDDFNDAYDRLTGFYPAMTGSLEKQGITPARHFMLKPTRRPDPTEVVVAMDDPIRQAREYIADGKYRQAVNWLETFMPVSDGERVEAQLLVGEAMLGDRRLPEAIKELGEVLLADPEEHRALRLLARAHAYNGNLEDAENLYSALAEAVPDDAEAHLHLGYLYALQSKTDSANEAFTKAFATDFDYLLHDIGPFFIAMKSAFSDDIADYEPPQVRRFDVAPPKSMNSRRSEEQNSLSILINHKGQVVAAHMGARNSGNFPLVMMSFVKATYDPATLNGVPVPALFRMGHHTSSTQ